MSYQDYKYGCSERPDSRVLFTVKSNPIPSIMSISIVVAACISGNPFKNEAYFNTGLFNVLIASLLPPLLLQISFQIFVRTWSYNSNTSYPEVIREKIGDNGISIIRILFILSMLNTQIYTNYDISKLSIIISKYFFPDNAFMNNIKFHLIFLSALAIFPTLFMVRFRQFGIVTYLCNAFVIIGLIVMGLYAYQ